MTDYWTRSLPPARPADASVAIAIDAASLLICIAILAHIIIGWVVNKKEWSIMMTRRCGATIAAVTLLPPALSLACSTSDGCSQATRVLIYNVIGGGVAYPIVVWIEMFIIYERYVAMAQADADLDLTSTEDTFDTDSNARVSRTLQVVSVLLAFASGGATLLWTTVLPLWVDVARGSNFYRLYRVMVDRVEVSCYALYVCMYLVLSIGTLRSIIASLRQHEFAPSLRRALWTIGWRAVAHVAAAVVAVSLFLAFPSVSLAYLDKRVLILINMHVFLVWLGWEEWFCAETPCFQCFDARVGAIAQYEAVRNASETPTSTADCTALAGTGDALLMHDEVVLIDEPSSAIMMRMTK